MSEPADTVTDAQEPVVPATTNTTTPSGPAAGDRDALQKLEKILASRQYMNMMESCRNFNRRLLLERRTRVPFIDVCTGLAQSDCRLWFDQRHRMPGLKRGQVYSYPAKRWVKRRRQYLTYFMQPKKVVLEECELAIASVQNPTFHEESSTSLNEGSKDAWFYEEAEIDREEFEENSDASDFDYDDRYKKKKKSASASKRSSSGRSGGSRRRTADVEDESKRPWGCERSRSRGSRTAAAHASAALAAQADMDKGPAKLPAQSSQPAPCPKVEKTEPEPPPAAPVATPQPPEKKTTPSQYCDFCLGDVNLNKKTGVAEELVSCSDCGRSGHPTCLQFTDNMVISVKKYRWQCIECKCCSLCGTSDNDDQLLFCDDCDRGYHMYCLSPPLTEPPEGSWSCHLCVQEFHNGRQPGSQPA